ncbi:MAG: ribosome maturation factor RimM [Parvularculaceae bacterium]
MRTDRADPTRLVCLGVFGAPHGVRGAIRMRTYTSEPGGVAAYGPVATKDGKRRFNLTVERVLRTDLAVVAAPEIDDRDDAKSLTGVEIFVTRDRLPPTTEEDEYYLEDLVGVRVVTDAGLPAGLVGAVHNFGAGDLLEIKGAPGRDAPVLIPFTKDLVPSVNVAGGRIIVAASAFDEDADEGERMRPTLIDAGGRLVSEDIDANLDAIRAEDA